MATTNADMIKWLVEMPTWVKDAVLTFYDKGRFEQDDIIRFADECIEDAENKKREITIGEIALLNQTHNNSLSISSIGEIEGVNALSSGKTLSFQNEGITVIYGENGAGKSGYIRILKKISDAKYKDELKQNVYSKNGDKQSCKIKIINNGKEQELPCNLSIDGEYSVLRGIDVFDTKIANAYISSAKEASYEPWIFILLRAVAKAAERIKEELQNRKAKYVISPIDIPGNIRDSKVGELLVALSAKTVIDDKELKWDKSSADQLEQLRKNVNEDALHGDIKRIDSEIRNLNSVKDYFDRFTAFYSEENIKEIAEKKNLWGKTVEEKNAAALIFEQTAEDVDKKSISNAAWVSLWKKADEYYNQVLISHGEKKYTEGGVCPLCRQIIGSDRLERMRSIDAFINGKISDEESKAKKKYVELLQLPKVWGQENLIVVLDGCNCEEIKDTSCDINQDISGLYDIISKQLYDQIRVEKLDISGHIKIIEDAISNRINAKNEKMRLLNDEETTNNLKAICELEARKYTSEIRERIEQQIDNCKKLEVIELAEKLTNSKKITVKSKELAKELITEDYIRRFDDELKLLTRNSIRVKLEQQAGKGSNPFKIKLVDTLGDTVSLDDVLSEGEKRVVALAAFFAESSGRIDKTPLIVDDPISSLDYLFEDAVIRRLVDIAKHRQVIVFTHRLSMLAGIDEQSEKNGVKFCEKRISGASTIKGVPIESVEFTGKADKQINYIKNTEIPVLKKLDVYSPEYTKQINYICQQIRIAVEKSIEDILLNGVVVRWRRAIHTLNKLDVLADISPEECEIINDMMTKYSYYDHSMGDDTPLINFTVEEIEQDLEKFAQWISVKKKANSRK